MAFIGWILYAIFYVTLFVIFTVLDLTFVNWVLHLFGTNLINFIS